MEIENDCRAEYGPLELRIQATVSVNGFTVYVDDPRVEPSSVLDSAVQSTLESAKEYVAQWAGEYLTSLKEDVPPETNWRCS
jgi:hypothetical protein